MSVWYQAGSGVNVGWLVGVGTSVGIAEGTGVDVGTSKGAVVGMVVGAGAASPQAERKKTTNKKQKRTDDRLFFTIIPRKNTAGQAGTKVHKRGLKNLCEPLSLMLLVSFVLRIFVVKTLLFMRPIQQ